MHEYCIYMLSSPSFVPQLLSYPHPPLLNPFSAVYLYVFRADHLRLSIL